MSLVLKSNQVIKGNPLLPLLESYRLRVAADGGVIKNESKLLEAFLTMKEVGLDASNTLAAASPSWGMKESGGRLVKLYDLFDPDADLVIENTGHLIAEKDNLTTFVSTGSSANVFLEPAKKVDSQNLSVFVAHTADPLRTTGAAGMLANIKGRSPTNIVLSLRFSHANDYYYDIYANSAAPTSELGLAGYSENIGANNSSGYLTIYRDGNVTGKITASMISSSQHYLDLAAQAAGNYYAVLAVHDTTEAQNVALSKFVADFI